MISILFTRINYNSLPTRFFYLKIYLPSKDGTGSPQLEVVIVRFTLPIKGP
jgi:hypothetical protein